MGALLGHLGISETDLAFISRMGQRVVYDKITEYLAAHTMDLQKRESILVDQETEDVQIQYKLPMSGYLQPRGGAARSGIVKRTGEWQVAFPMTDWGAEFVTTDVIMAQMTPVELETHVEGLRQQDVNTRRREIMRAIFRNTSRTYTDNKLGNVTIKPLANGDTDVYPPILGSETDATQDNYIVTGYTTANISSSNNPCITVRDRFEDFFGAAAGFGSVVTFANRTDIPKYEALPDFVKVEDIHVRTGANTDVPTGLPNVPGRIVGRCDGVWVVSYQYIPANYSLSLDLEQPKPLYRRIDPASMRAVLGSGLQLVAVSDKNPLVGTEVRDRFGIAVANRLNGVVMQFKAPGSYDIPAAYA